MRRAGGTAVINRTSVLENAALFILLAVSGLRPLIPESYDLAGADLTRSLPGVADPLPVATLLFDAAILVAGLCWGLARLRGRAPGYRWCGLEPGLGLIAVAIVISCIAASNRRTAINASVDWLAMALLALALAQLVRDGFRRRLVISVVVASGAAQAYQCFEQVLVSFPETEQHYRENREEIWRSQGVSLDAPQVELFERRMAAREASGYLSHSNIAAAHLLLAFFAALGLALSGFHRPAVGGFGLALAGFILAAMFLTHSFGAVLACFSGLTLAAVLHVGRGWLGRHRTAALLAGWSAVLIGGLAVAGYGLARGKLPGESLSFRWGYWTASAELIRDHPWTGVGRENFGYSYLQYKSIAWPEEVKNPHNFLITAASEWGLPGLAGVLLMLTFGSARLSRTPLPAHADLREASAAGIRSGGRWLALLAVGVFAPRWFLLGSDDPNYLYVATAAPAFVWAIAFAIGMLVPAHSPAPGHWLWLAIGAGLFAFLLQDTINFATVVPGAATPFFALLGAALAARIWKSDAERMGRGWIPAAAFSLALLALGFMVIWPVWRAGRLLMAARSAAELSIAGDLASHPADRLYRQAAAADLLDPAAALERADWLRRFAAGRADPRPSLAAALEALDEAAARNERDFSIYGRQASTALALAQVTSEPSERDRLSAQAIAAARRALELYPARPAGYVELAGCLKFAGKVQNREDLMREALSGYRYALALDAQRPAWETIRRLRPRQLADIEANIVAIESWLAARGAGP